MFLLFFSLFLGVVDPGTDFVAVLGDDDDAAAVAAAMRRRSRAAVGRWLTRTAEGVGVVGIGGRASTLSHRPFRFTKVGMFLVFYQFSFIFSRFSPVSFVSF